MKTKFHESVGIRTPHLSIIDNVDEELMSVGINEHDKCFWFQDEKEYSSQIPYIDDQETVDELIEFLQEHKHKLKKRK